MTLSLLQIVAFSLSLSGFGVSQNPTAPSGAEVTKYAPAKADFMLYMDVQSVVPKNYAAFKALAKDPALKAIPELKRELEQAISQAEMGLGMARSAIGMDPINDIKTVAAWAKYPGAGKPSFLIVVRGNFPANFVDKLAGLGAPTKRIGGRTAIEQDGATMMQAPDGSILFGSKNWVVPRSKPGFRSRARGPAVRLLNQKPFFLALSTPSKTAVRRMLRELGGRTDNVLRDIISGHKMAAVAMYHDGVGWDWNAKTGKGFQRAKQASNGMIKLMRASHFAARGVADLLFSALESYKRQREVKMVLRHKRDLMKLVTDFSGTGNFKVTRNNNARTRTVSIRARGSKLSDVLPPVSLPAAAGLFFFLGATSHTTAPSPVR